MKHLKKLYKDVVSETPKIYKWISGVLVSISISAGVAMLAYSNFPIQFQILPESCLKIISAAGLIGAVIAKKQNVK